MLTAKEAAPTITLSAEELEHLTGYRQPSRQLAVLRDLGFWRARRSVTGEVILERAHYDEVSRGRSTPPANQPKLRPALRRAA